MWLPQASPEPGADESEECLRADRFKSPELLLLSDWLAELPRESGLDPVRVSRRLLETYGYLLGRALAAAHGAPLVTPEGGRWTLRWPFLGAAEAILTYPQCAWSATSAEPFSLVFDGVGRELCRGLSSAWAAEAHRMVADPAAARAGPSCCARTTCTRPSCCATAWRLSRALCCAWGRHRFRFLRRAASRRK